MGGWVGGVNLQRRRALKGVIRRLASREGTRPVMPNEAKDGVHGRAGVWKMMMWTWTGQVKEWVRAEEGMRIGRIPWKGGL